MVGTKDPLFEALDPEGHHRCISIHQVGFYLLDPPASLGQRVPICYH